jgi:hypothetical protein
MKFYIILLASFALIKSSFSVKCFHLKDDEVRVLWGKWNQAINSGIVDNIVNLYWDQSILIPTFSNHIRNDNPTKYEYFEHLLMRKPSFLVKRDFIDTSGCNMAQYSGIYELSITEPQSFAIAKFSVRFSYTYQTFDGKVWSIKTDHSSLMEDPLKSSSSNPTNEALPTSAPSDEALPTSAPSEDLINNDVS